ncbi:MAG: BamA/TamA family outer membrane protein, partial [Proteobacteria bacterium]|nr:BamA/TamA family outer membrane protein [Pseudomonadota bacterium]
GFLTAGISVEPLEFQPYGDGRQVVDVVVTVREGGQSLIGDLEIRSDLQDSSKFLEITGLREGDPYVPEAVQKAREDILTWLSSTGYLYAEVALSEQERRGEDIVDLVFSVEEGPQVKLGRIIVTGNENVKSEIIRLALDLDEGEILTLEKILNAQERVYDLGVMNSVEAELVDPGNPAQRKDLIVTVSERFRYVVGFKVGYGSEDKARGEAAVTHRNVGGMARSLTLKARKSAIESRTSLLYRHPWFSSRPIDFSASLSDVVEERDTYSRDAYSASLDFTRKMSRRTEVGLGYVFEGLRLFDVSPGAQLSPDDEGKTDVAAMIWEIIYDSRDDILDPWSGLLADFRLEAASRGLGSAAEYLKYELASHHYISLGKETVLAGLLRLGYAAPYGQSEEVIISKRFFLGGQNSVRGFALDGLGPKDAEGDPIGGDLMVNANVEIRFPLVRTFRGVCFLDSGSVWFRRGGEGFHLRSSMGAGLRWSSPIGPLSLDYGYQINPDPEDTDDRYRWHLSIGHAF